MGMPRYNRYRYDDDDIESMRSKRKGSGLNKTAMIALFGCGGCVVLVIVVLGICFATGCFSGNNNQQQYYGQPGATVYVQQPGYSGGYQQPQYQQAPMQYAQQPVVYQQGSPYYRPQSSTTAKVATGAAVVGAGALGIMAVDGLTDGV